MGTNENLRKIIIFQCHLFCTRQPSLLYKIDDRAKTTQLRGFLRSSGPCITTYDTNGDPVSTQFLQKISDVPQAEPDGFWEKFVPFGNDVDFSCGLGNRYDLTSCAGYAIISVTHRKWSIVEYSYDAWHMPCALVHDVDRKGEGHGRASA